MIDFAHVKEQTFLPKVGPIFSPLINALIFAGLNPKGEKSCPWKMSQQNLKNFVFHSVTSDFWSLL